MEVRANDTTSPAGTYTGNHDDRSSAECSRAHHEAGRQPIRVFVIDDHPMIRHGPASMIRAEREFEWVGDAADGEDVRSASPPRWHRTPRPRRPRDAGPRRRGHDQGAEAAAAARISSC
ncbi:MAG: hypothetical protein U1F67_02795 [Rubrivivax sp.]